MAVWYEVGKTEEEANAFLRANWEFHDFRQERFSYVPGKDMVEVLYGYDNGGDGALLRFVGIRGMRVDPAVDYDADWIGGSALVLPHATDGTTLLWLERDERPAEDDLEERKSWTTTWVEADRLFWAHTDGSGSPVEMPAEWIGYTAGMEFHGDWDSVLKPWYDRL